MSGLSDEARARAWRELDAELRRRLDEMGPGWAVGWRLKDVGESGNVMDYPSVVTSYEFHTSELVNGKPGIGLVGFEYVTLASFGEG